jgi:hypothetical protein
MKKTGFWFYLWALVLNAGIVFNIVFKGGVSGFEASYVGWVCAALALYLFVVIGIIWHGHISHPVIKYGIPCVVLLLFGYEFIFVCWPSLNFVTLALLIFGRISDIRGERIRGKG